MKRLRLYYADVCVNGVYRVRNHGLVTLLKCYNGTMLNPRRLQSRR